VNSFSNLRKYLILAMVSWQIHFALSPVPWCPASRKLPPSNAVQFSPVRLSLQNTSQARLGDVFEFTVFNFDTGRNILLPATARYTSLLEGGMPLTLWVSNSAWSSSTPNNLNHNGVQFSLQTDRLTTLQEIARVLEEVIFPQVQAKLGNLANPSQARYSGIHFLLYDIPDSFDRDGSFVGGYFYPDDQRSPNQMNLMHMDLRPSNPAGRTQSNSGTRDDFYHTLAHELFHLYHYQKVGDAVWDNTAEWFSEGLAQFAIFWFLENQVYPSSQEAILSVPTEAPGQVPFYLDNPQTTYLLDYQGISRALPVEYYGLGYLFFTHLWHQLGLDANVRNSRLLSFLENKVDHLPKLQTTLSSQGLDFRQIFKDFALAQYFENPVYGLDFISLQKNALLGQMQAAPRVDLATISERMTSLRNYELEYLALENNSENTQRILFESRCHLGTDPCGRCSAPPAFDLLQVADRREIESCFQSPNFEACFLGIQRNIRAYQGSRIQAKMRPGKSTFIYWTSSNSCDKGFNSFGITAVTPEPYQGLPYFSKPPTLVLTENRLEASFTIADDNSDFAQLSFQIKSPDLSFPHFPTESISTPGTTISVAAEQALTWYFLEDYKSLKNRELHWFLKDPQSEVLGEGYDFTFFSEPKLATQTYSIEIKTGWNMLAFEPQNPQETLGSFFDGLRNFVALEPCVYFYKNHKLWALNLEGSSCSSEILSTWRNQALDWGQGFILKALEDKTLVLNRVLSARWKYQLDYGWNLRSLGLRSLPQKGQVPPTVPVVYRYTPSELLWRKQEFYGKNGLDSILPIEENYETYHAHWIYSLRKRAFVRP
jgi:hypothetical protein